MDVNRTPLFSEVQRGRPPGISDDEDVEIPVADVQALSLERGRRLITRHAGIFLFLPLLSELRFDRMVDAAGYAGTQMIPPANALLSLKMFRL